MPVQPVSGPGGCTVQAVNSPAPFPGLTAAVPWRQTLSRRVLIAHFCQCNRARPSCCRPPVTDLIDCEQFCGGDESGGQEEASDREEHLRAGAQRTVG